ncbi:hypothetical protein LC593_23445 [Nostoc sp. CHAB 5844]|nr:hypothetical protein [Nostoc sp. CHAB 5844]
MNKERIRIDLWAGIKPIVESEIERSGLTAQEVVNIALADYFGLSPKGKDRNQSLPSVSKEVISNDEDEDYI